METGAGQIDGSSSKAVADSDEVVNKSVMVVVPVDVKKDVEQQLESASQVAEAVVTVTPVVLAPITPLPVKEVRDRDVRVPRAAAQCRLALAKINAETSEEECECGSPSTPKQGVFDPFAPGPDDMCLAPKLRKKTSESRISVVRQLDFDALSSSKSGGVLGEMSLDEEKLLETVCADIPEVIVPSMAELDEAEKVAPDTESDGFKTPPLVPAFNGTRNKCPDAPMKQGRTTSKRQYIDSSLCRKLEF